MYAYSVSALFVKLISNQYITLIWLLGRCFNRLLAHYPQYSIITKALDVHRKQLNLSNI